MLKGHTRIELKNVETGEVKVHEEINMLTDAYPRLLKPLGDSWSILQYNRSAGSEFWDRAVGGVVIFDKNLDEDPTLLIAPNDANPIGSAGAVANTGTDPMLGSYNASESEITPTSIKRVWDFDTNEANGTIGCICLTSDNGGIIGYGHKEFDTDVATSYIGYASPHGFQYSADAVTNPQTSLAYAADNTAYFIDYFNLVYSADHAEVYARSTKKLVFRKFFLPITQFSMRARNTNEPIEEIEVDIPTTLANILTANTTALYGSLSYDDGNIYVLLNNTASIAAGATFYVMKIPVTETGLGPVELITMQNSTGVALDVKVFCYYYGHFQYVDNSHVYTIGTDKHVYRMSLANSADVAQLADAYGNPITLTYRDNGFRYMFVDTGGGYLYLKERYNAKGQSTTTMYSYQCPYMINKASGVMWCSMISAIGLIPQPSNTKFPMQKPYIGNPSVVLQAQTDGVYPYAPPNYLFTINNVYPTVTKTPAQTMKITYTLTEDE